MVPKHTLAFLLAALMTTPLALAGEPEDPEVVDAADATLGALDIRSMWITHDDAYVYFNLKVQDLGAANPLDAGLHSYRWNVSYRVSHSPALRIVTWGVIHAQNGEAFAVQAGPSRYTGVGAEHYGVGNAAGTSGYTPAGSSSGGAGTTVRIDAETDTIVLGVLRANGIGPSTVVRGFRTGDTLYDIVVESASQARPGYHDDRNQLPMDLRGYAPVDKATTQRSYNIA